MFEYCYKVKWLDKRNRHHSKYTSWHSNIDDALKEAEDMLSKVDSIESGFGICSREVER